MTTASARVIEFPSDQFDAAWSSLTETMRKRSCGKPALRPIWAAHGKQIGYDNLLAALRLYVAQDFDIGRTGGPGLQVWLRARRYEHWLQRALEPPPEPKRFADEALRQSFAERFPDERAIRWFDRSKLEGDTLIVPWAPKQQWADGPFRRWAVAHCILGWRVINPAHLTAQ